MRKITIEFALGHWPNNISNLGICSNKKLSQTIIKKKHKNAKCIANEWKRKREMNGKRREVFLFSLMQSCNAISCNSSNRSSNSCSKLFHLFNEHDSMMQVQFTHTHNYGNCKLNAVILSHQHISIRCHFPCVCIRWNTFNRCDDDQFAIFAHSQLETFIHMHKHTFISKVCLVKWPN